MLSSITVQKLDDTDKRIIRALEKNAHMSSIKLSKLLDIHAQTIRRRVNKLIQNDLIRIQAVQIKRAKTSLTVPILLKVENNAIVCTADLLASQPEIGFVVLSVGAYNIVCIGWFETIEAYSKFLNTVLYPLKGVLEIDTSIGTEYRKYAFVKLPRGPRPTKTVMKPVDDIDMKIIAVLEKDAHQNSKRLAKSLNISAPTVRHRVNNLLKNNIIHIQAVPNLRIGKMISAFVVLNVDKGSLNRVADYLSSMDEVRGVLLVTGSYDIGIWAWFESIEAFSEFFNNHINPLEEVGKRIIMIVTEIRKWAHMW